MSHSLAQQDEGEWEPIEDDVLRLVFAACHPVLGREAQVAMTLRVVGGLSSEEIARMFLVPVPTMQQRIVRAKKTLTAARVPFEVPDPTEWAERLDAVLSVIYLVFTEGYAATAGERWTSRTAAGGTGPRSRVGERRSPGPTRSEGDAATRGRGNYALQAAIAQCHASATSVASTDWERVVLLYEALGRLTDNPVVELNRAAAVSMTSGPARALEITEDLVSSGALRGSHLLASVRGELLARLGRADEARDELVAAADRVTNQREREVLLAKVEALADDGSTRPERS